MKDHNGQPPLTELLSRAQNHLADRRYDQAATLFSRILKLIPDNADICFSAGNAFRHIGDYERAAQLFSRAVAIQSDFFAALCNLGAALTQTGRLDKAADALEKATLLQPGRIEVGLELAKLYIRQSSAGKAHDLLLGMLERTPDSPDILMALGDCALAGGNAAEAKERYLASLRLRPDSAQAHYRLGTIMRDWNNLDEAVACFANSLKFRPDDTATIVNLGEAFQVLGETDLSEKQFRKAIEIDPQCSMAQHNLLVSMNYNPKYDAQTIDKAHTQWGNALIAAAKPHSQWSNDPCAYRRLRIGILSPDLCNHPAASFLEPMFTHLDRSQFELFCYSHTVHEDWRTELFREKADFWTAIEHLGDSTVCKRIRDDRIDILMGTAGHLGENRLEIFGLKPAPIQICGIGYPGIIGLPTVDYRISDALIDPPCEKGPACNERPLRLESCFCCYTMPRNPPAVEPLPALKNGFITFGSLHTTARLNEKVISLWSSVLRAVENSRLLLCRATITASVVQRLSSWFEQEQIDLSRIEFQREIPQSGHLTVYNSIDISLDTLPWSGHTTACESLVMGVPVISLYGERQSGRMVSSILAAANLPGIIAADANEFVRIAVRMAQDTGELATLRRGMRSRLAGSALCNGPGYIDNLQKQFRTLWREWCENH